jgi:transposase
MSPPPTRSALRGITRTQTALPTLATHRTADLGSYVRQSKSGRLQLDTAKIAREAKLVGKYLISTSDDYLSAEDVALGYKQLHEIERVHRDLKHTVDLRPVNHRREDRIRAHVLLCWLALLLIRVTENETGQTWHNLKNVMWPLMAAQHRSRHGVISQTNALTKAQKTVLDALAINPPKRYLDLPTPIRHSHST